MNSPKVVLSSPYDRAAKNRMISHNDYDTYLKGN